MASGNLSRAFLAGRMIRWGMGIGIRGDGDGGGTDYPFFFSFFDYSVARKLKADCHSFPLQS